MMNRKLLTFSMLALLCGGCSTMGTIAKHLSKDSSVVHVDVARRMITRVGAAGLSTNSIVVNADGSILVNSTK